MNRRDRPARSLLRFAALALCAFAATSSFAGTASPRHALGWQSLHDGRNRGEVDLGAFAPAADATAPSRVFEGSLRIHGKPRTRTIHVDEAYLAPSQLAAARGFPADFDYEFVQDGGTLLPVRRGYITTTHPYWDVVLEPGRVWNEPGDRGETRAALPFALVQKHMNCTHYGVLSFVFGDGGRISHVAMQVGSETCNYLKLDMWGMFEAHYTPHTVAAKRSVIEAFHANRARRLPTRPIAQLASDHPGVDPARLAIGEPAARTLHGLVVDGVNYVSACPTRHGDYPYCDVLPFPSYSTAKSAVAALALMAVEHEHPGTRATQLVDVAPAPACATEAWRGVTLGDLADMATGHYHATGYMADEDAPAVRGFFAATTAAAKTRFACGAYPRRAAPGKAWAYHTSDTFLLGEALRRVLRRQPGHDRADVFRDVVDARIYAPLDLSATARASRRTADRDAQALFGYGVQFHRDDIARLASFIGQGRGAIGDTQVLDRGLLELALQRVDGKRGQVVTAYPDFRYQLGFWARDVAPLLHCRQSAWVPFMSGFGGISVVLFAHGIVYYSVADSGSAAAFDWSPAAVEVNRIRRQCR